MFIVNTKSFQNVKSCGTCSTMVTFKRDWAHTRPTASGKRLGKCCSWLDIRVHDWICLLFSRCRQKSWSFILSSLENIWNIKIGNFKPKAFYRCNLTELDLLYSSHTIDQTPLYVFTCFMLFAGSAANAPSSLESSDFRRRAVVCSRPFRYKHCRISSIKRHI